MLTTLEEVMATLDDLVGEGEVLHSGLSNNPARHPARALQVEYPLAGRSIRREFVAAARWRPSHAYSPANTA